MIDPIALEDAVYWLLCERSAQMGEAYTHEMHEAAKAEDQDYISDIRFQVKSAIKAYDATYEKDYLPSVKVGKYLITAYPESIWISLYGDGEGGGFDETKVEAAIDQFYQENF